VSENEPATANLLGTRRLPAARRPQG
jgi:hypothetical protein